MQSDSVDSTRRFTADDPRYPSLEARIHELFAANHQGGKVQLTYTTHLYWAS